jgi:hypothetical protein
VPQNLWRILDFEPPNCQKELLAKFSKNESGMAKVTNAALCAIFKLEVITFKQDQRYKGKNA